MSIRNTPAPVLVLTWGNPSRGDDALGPALYDLLMQHKSETGELDHVDVFTDFQLQIEHAVDIEKRQLVIFVASHAMSPASVLAVYQQVKQENPPPAFLLTIRAYEFGLGKEMSSHARANLEAAFSFILTKITRLGAESNSTQTV
jgi:Ni,Fe-hydrogenase maturation factor